MEKKGLWGYIRQLLGFYKNPDYVEDYLREADAQSTRNLTAVVIAIEIWMLIRQLVRHWERFPTVASFFKSTWGYWVLLSAAGLLCLYSILYLCGRLNKSKKFICLFIFLYFLLGLYFGTSTSLFDLSRGRMITCFLTMIMTGSIIVIWRPYISLLVTLIPAVAFVYIVNHFAVGRDGKPWHMSEAEIVNYTTFVITLAILEISAYIQRHKEAWKSYMLEKAAVTDDLTNIPNMRKFEEVAAKYCKKCLAEGKHPVYIICDITNFKTYNDRFGYEAGDALLRFMAQIIAVEFEGEPFARHSNDKFVILTAKEDYIEKGRRGRDWFRAERSVEVYLDLKAGVYPVTHDNVEPRHAVDRASYAMSLIKNVDEEPLKFYDETLQNQYRLRQYVLNNIDKAVQNGYIKVYYQPVIWAEDGTLCGFEALARWIDPEIGFLSPSQFIPLLEEIRQIHKLDKCIYESVCQQMRDCLDKNLPVLPTSMNFSRLDFELMDAVAELESLVKKYQIPKNLLHVEITESALSKDVKGLQEAMDRLHGLGYVIWLDDFGSGYSSMNVLKDFKFDLLKIDMEFLKNFSGNDNAHKIIQSIISLSKSLNMQSLTEGVETQEMVDFLRECGCGRLQGFFFGKPMPYEEILAKIADGTYKLKSSS